MMVLTLALSCLIDEDGKNRKEGFLFRMLILRLEYPVRFHLRMLVTYIIYLIKECVR